MSSRREFIAVTGAGLATAALRLSTPAQAAAPANPFSKWRGFYLGSVGGSGEGSITHTSSLEDDLSIVTDWGFNAVRLRTDYTQWLTFTDKTPQGMPYPKDFMSLNEAALVRIDTAVNLALKHKLRVLLCMFHGPGYDVRDAAFGSNNYTGPYNLATDRNCQEAFAYYWGMLARRYSGVPADMLAFDLLNEPLTSNFANLFTPEQYIRTPTGLTAPVYARIVKMAVESIRNVSPERPIFGEGLGRFSTADTVVPELVPLNIGQSLHGYYPLDLSHFGTPVDRYNQFKVPTWPMKMGKGVPFGTEQLRAFYKPFGDLVRQGVPVLCGEFGVSSVTPNDVAMRWTADMLQMFNDYGIGWMYLNLRGFAGAHGEWTGLVDSVRRDVAFEDYHGHSLNRQMLNLLQKH